MQEINKEQAGGEVVYSTLHEHFRRFAKKIAEETGTAKAFMLAVVIIAVWLLTGPIFNFSDTWQLVINTGTTIVTFLMVFLIQNTQNRDSKAIHLKLDEIIRSISRARNQFFDVEDFTDEDLERLKQDFENRLRSRKGKI